MIYFSNLSLLCDLKQSKSLFCAVGEEKNHRCHVTILVLPTGVHISLATFSYFTKWKNQCCKEPQEVIKILKILKFRQVTLGFVQLILEKIQEQRLPNLSGQPVLMTDYPHSDFFLYFPIQLEVPLLQFMTTVSLSGTSEQRVFFMSDPHTAYIYSITGKWWQGHNNEFLRQYI